MLARAPVSGAPIGMPARSTPLPARMSSPRLRTCVPRGTGSNTRTSSPPASVISTCAIASAPSGTVAPVMIRAAVPVSTRAPRNAAGGNVFDHAQHRGRFAARAGHVGRADRVAVHGAVVCGREIGGRPRRPREARGRTRRSASRARVPAARFLRALAAAPLRLQASVRRSACAETSS